MSIEHSIVSCRHFFIDDHVLNASIGVLHVGSLSDIANYTSVVAFHQEFESTDTESMTRSKAIAFLIKEAPVHSTRLPAIHVEVPQNQGVVVENDLEVVLYDAITM